MSLPPFAIARALLGVHEKPDPGEHPGIAWMLTLCHGPADDEIPWCSAFANFCCRLAGVDQRTNTLRARDWLGVGTPVALDDARTGNDVVVLKRGDNPELGHVGFYAGHDSTTVAVLGGNQSDAVTVARFRHDQVVGIRRVA